jgi:hypothetical protein
LGSKVIGRILGTTLHDLLVPTSSSLPPLNVPVRAAPLYNRSHFEYFSKVRHDAAAPAHFAETVARMQLPAAAPAASAG